MVHWTPDDWQTTNDSKTIDTGLGVHYVDLPTNRLSPDSKIVSTSFWPTANKWEGIDFQATVGKRTTATVRAESSCLAIEKQQSSNDPLTMDSVVEHDRLTSYDIYLS